MTDTTSSSTNSDSEQVMNDALADVDRSLATLDKIIEKHAKSIAGNLLKIGGSKNAIAGLTSRQTSSIVGNSISAFIGAISNASSLSSASASSDSDSANRYPASSGLQMSDLASLLQRVTGRNL